MPNKWLSFQKKLTFTLLVAELINSISIGRPVPEYAKSCMYVADYQTTAADGDLELAREYLERLAASNAEEVSQATELLKKVKDMIVKTHDGAEAQTKVTVGESAGPSQPTVENTGPESGNGPAMTTG